MRKLTSDQIAEAKRRHADGVPMSRLARDYGVSAQTISNWLFPERRADRMVNTRAEDYDRLRAEAQRRGVPMARLVHELIERGIPHDVPEAAE